MVKPGTYNDCNACKHCCNIRICRWKKNSFNLLNVFTLNLQVRLRREYAFFDFCFWKGDLVLRLFLRSVTRKSMIANSWLKWTYSSLVILKWHQNYSSVPRNILLSLSHRTGIWKEFWNINRLLFSLHIIQTTLWQSTLEYLHCNHLINLINWAVFV